MEILRTKYIRGEQRKSVKTKSILSGSVNTIYRAVIKCSDASERNLLKQSKKRSHVEARIMFFCIASNLTMFTDSTLIGFFNYKAKTNNIETWITGTTVSHYRRRFNELLKHNKEFKEYYSYICKEVEKQLLKCN